MSYISEIFKRLDIQSIREFLLHGVEENEIDTRSYIERIKASEKGMFHMLHSKFPDDEEYENVSGPVLDYTNTIQNVYMEIGMQCGFVLVMQIMEKFE